MTRVLDFLTPEEEKELLGAIDAAPWDTSLRRRTQHYGFRYDYNTRMAPERTTPLPDWCADLARRLVAAGHFASMPDQVIVNEYMPGQGIALHYDSLEFGPAVASISLGGPVLVDFVHRRDGRAVSVDAQPRSLYVMTGPSRYEWMHGIATRKTDAIGGKKHPRSRRVSVTFRTMANRKRELDDAETADAKKPKTESSSQ